MRAITSTAIRLTFLAGTCLAAACGSDTPSSTEPIVMAGTLAPSVGGTGTSSAGVGSATAGMTGAPVAGVTGPAAAGRGTAGVMAGAGSAAGTMSMGMGGRSGTGAMAGMLAAGSGGRGGMGAGGTASGGTGGMAGGAGTGGMAGGAGTGATGAATFTAVYKIIMTNCASAGACHGSTTRPSGGLSMVDQMAAYTNLVGVNSTSCTGEKRVVASDPAKSELVHTLDRTMIGTCTRTPKMPDNKPKLAQADIDTVTAWIMAGAMNN